MITVRSKKNDQEGNKGYKYVFTLADAEDKYCYVSEMWEYATLARPAARAPFFAVPELQWTLKAPELATHLKARDIAFPPDWRGVNPGSGRVN